MWKQSLTQFRELTQIWRRAVERDKAPPSKLGGLICPAGRGVAPRASAELSAELERAGVVKDLDAEPLQSHRTKSHLL